MTALLAQVGAGAEAFTGSSGGTPELIAFVLVGGLGLGAAVAMVLLRNPVHSALMLVVNFFALAVLFALLEAQFLAAVQIIVYAGAIMVLFLFVLMLLGVSTEQSFTDRIRGQKPAAILLGLALFAALAGAVAGPYLGPDSVCGIPPAAGAAGAAVVAPQGPNGLPCVGLAAANTEGNVRGVGLLLFTDYVWPFEVTSVLLVIAALGAMVMGRRHEAPEELVDQLPPRVMSDTSEEVG